MITITAKKTAIRRCGVLHSGTTDYENSEWSPEQLAILQDEPLLEVTVTEAQKDGARAMYAALTVATLTEKLTQLKVDIPKDAKKADLVELILVATTFQDGDGA